MYNKYLHIHMNIYIKFCMNIYINTYMDIYINKNINDMSIHMQFSMIN